jgi:hypothetical protein
MVGTARRVPPRTVARVLGLVVVAAVLAAVTHAAGWHSDPTHRPRAAVSAAQVHLPVLPTRALDLVAAAPVAVPAGPGWQRLDSRPAVAPLAPQDRRGHADRGPPVAAPTS